MFKNTDKILYVTIKGWILSIILLLTQPPLIVLEKILQDLLRFLVRYIQAQRGVVLLYNHDKNPSRLQIEAELESGQSKAVIHSIPFESYSNVSKGVINRVKETGTDLVVHDIDNNALIVKDNYFKDRKVKSVICLPILKGEELLGFLYLENGKVMEALTPSEVELLRYFSSQAAISIENTKLYTELKTLNQYFIEKNLELSKEIKKRRLTEMKLASKNKELDTFFYKASHDLKGPVASIMGLTNLAGDLFGKDAVAEYIGHIDDSAKKLDHILLNLINVTKINNSQLKTQEVDIETIIHEQLQALSSRPELKSIDVTIKVDVKKRFFTDKSQLGVILRNLLENSILYYDKSKSNPEIRIEAIDFGGGIKLAIHDNGIGVNENSKNSIFEMFYRGTQRSTGAGLGLYIVKAAATKLRGTVSYKSKVNEGASFYVYLPNG